MNAPPDPHAPAPTSVSELEEILSRPPERLVEAFRQLRGDLILLGVGGKMGPTMARMARRAFQQAGVGNRVMGVSRFRDRAVKQRLESWGVTTIACDLLDETAVAALPDAAHVIAMSGFKFGASEHPERAWATNCYMPALICRRYRASRIVAFSTGNVYGLVPRSSGGSVETDPLRPDGEYAMTALGRERMYEYFCNRLEVPTTLLRLNYATELRYGVLVDLARQVQLGEPVDLSMSYVNVIWLADANAMSLLALEQTRCPARVINLAGPEVLSTRQICAQLAGCLGVDLRVTGQEREDALLNNGHLGHQLLGQPEVLADQMIRWTARWVAQGGALLDKPTHFQTRSGKF